MTDLQTGIAARARRWDRMMMETVGRNSGPEIDHWLAGVHQPPGTEWCAAFACAQAFEAAAAIGLVLTLRPSAGALRLLALNRDLVVKVPEPGDFVIENHGEGKGHVIICTAATVVGGALAAYRGISGNTNAQGSRTAEFVWEKDYDVPGLHPIAGFLRIA